VPELPNPLTVPGTYWCAVVSYYDGSGIRGVYGPWPRKARAEEAVRRLQEAGIFEHDNWNVMPLRQLDLGEPAGTDLDAWRKERDGRG